MGDDVPPQLAGEFPFSAEQRTAPATYFEMTQGARVEVEFPERAETVREIHHSDRFGVVATGLAPEAALDIAAIDPSANSTWDALGTVLCALANADCTVAEIMDYLAVRKCGFDAEEWADATESANVRTIRQNANRAAKKLAQAKNISE